MKIRLSWVDGCMILTDKINPLLRVNYEFTFAQWNPLYFNLCQIVTEQNGVQQTVLS